MIKTAATNFPSFIVKCIFAFQHPSHSHRGSRETVANGAAFAVVLQSQLWSLKSSRLCLASHLRCATASSKRRQGTRRPPPAQLRKTQEHETTLRGYRALLFRSLRIPPVRTRRVNRVRLGPPDTFTKRSIACVGLSVSALCFTSSCWFIRSYPLNL